MNHKDQEHGPYLAAVVAAFEAAKLTVPDWHADDYDPRGGAIQLDPDQLNVGHEETWVGWQEERGWFVLTEDERGDGQKPSRFVYDLDCANLCNPVGVVRAVCVFFAVAPGDWMAAEDGYPAVSIRPHHWEDDDEEFEAALAVYAEVAR